MLLSTNIFLLQPHTLAFITTTQSDCITHIDYEYLVYILHFNRNYLLLYKLNHNYWIYRNISNSFSINHSPNPPYNVNNNSTFMKK